ncbi:MAG: YbhB/YbcL family Raf kinase inhibitor-like protein, partial [Pirellula sp.]
LPLVWTGAPEGTKSFAIVMDHIDRDRVLKTYWNLYDIPPEVTSLAKNSKGVGKNGATWKKDQAYVPPHSAGGAKQTYTVHIYALSERPEFDSSTAKVTREDLLLKIQDAILDSADLNVTYTRPRENGDEGTRPKGDGQGKRKEDRE